MLAELNTGSSGLFGIMGLSSQVNAEKLKRIQAYGILFLV